MIKRRIFIDFDNTLIDSIDAVCSVYNELYCLHPNFKIAEPELIQQYNFSDICPLTNNILTIFQHPLFFKFAKLINNNTYKVLEGLNNKYKPIVCSIGTPVNIAYKARWLEDNIPFVKDYVLISNPTCKMNKDIVNMQDSLFLDDVPSNLISSNANEEDKYLFGKRYPWNDELLWDGNWLGDWTEVGDSLL